MAQYLPATARDYYDPTPGWQFGLGVAENIERARANRARELAEKFRAEQAAKNEAAQLEIQKQNAETNEKYRQAQLEDAIRQRARQELLDQQTAAQQKLPAAILGIAGQPANTPGNFVMRPEFQEKRGISPQVILEANQQTGTAPSQAILGELARPSLDAKQQMAIELIRERAANRPQSIGVDANPVSRALTRYNELRKDPDVSPEEVKTQQQLLQSFAIKNGSQVTFDDAGNAIIQPGLQPALRSKLEAGIQASGAAIKLLESLDEKKIKEGFGFGAAMRDVGQSLGGANFGLGHTETMTEIDQILEAVKPMIRTGIQDEKGATTEGDVARAGALLANFRKNSPEQAKQRINGVIKIFKQAQERQASALKKAPSVQKEEREAGQEPVVLDIKVNPPRQASPPASTLPAGWTFTP